MMTSLDLSTLDEEVAKDSELTNEEEDQFVVGSVTRSGSSFALKSRLRSDSSISEQDTQNPFPIILRRSNTVSSSELRKRQSKLRFFNRKKNPAPQFVMADSTSQLALFHHLRGNSLIKQV